MREEPEIAAFRSTPNLVKSSRRKWTRHETSAYSAISKLSSPWDCWNRCRLSLCPRKRFASARSCQFGRARACGPVNMPARFAGSASIPMLAILPSLPKIFQNMRFNIPPVQTKNNPFCHSERSEESLLGLRQKKERFFASLRMTKCGRRDPEIKWAR
jgi:hypothetical protein